MHVIVPTIDLVTTLSKFRPLRSLTTTGCSFVVYTLEAYEDKLKVTVGDRSTILASMEVFAQVKKPGKVSINGSDFYENVVKIIPAEKSSASGSKEITLKVVDTKLHLWTETFYNKLNSKVAQKRSFQRAVKDVFVNPQNKPTRYNVSIKARHLSEVFKVSSRLISSYTSDIDSLSGVLLRVRGNQLLSVVSDGKRMLEVVYPYEVEGEDFDIILPKLTVSFLQGVIDEGDVVDVYADNRRAHFCINSVGLLTYVESPILSTPFPEYSSIFDIEGNEFIIDAQVLLDNVMNIRKSLNDDTFRFVISYDGEVLSLHNTKSSSHIEFSNSGLPIKDVNSSEFSITLNAFLFEGLLSVIKSRDIKFTIPPNNKPIVMMNQEDDLKIRAAIAVALE